MTDSRHKIVGKILDLGIAVSNKIHGCSPDEIDELEKQEGVRLPQAYREFLETMGHGAGSLMDDAEVFYNDIFGLSDEARSILDEGPGNLTLPDNAFVFAMRQGEQFLFFLIEADSEDPPIYHYFEGDEAFTKKFESIWSFVEAEVRFLESTCR